jgi:hypothetical protein
MSLSHHFFLYLLFSILLLPSRIVSSPPPLRATHRRVAALSCSPSASPCPFSCRRAAPAAHAKPPLAHVAPTTRSCMWLGEADEVRGGQISGGELQPDMTKKIQIQRAPSWLAHETCRGGRGRQCASFDVLWRAWGGAEERCKFLANFRSQLGWCSGDSWRVG